MRIIVAGLFAMLVSIAAPAAFAEVPAAKSAENAKEADIRRLLDATGSADIGMQVIDQILPSFQQAMPQVPEKFWKEFRNELKPEEMLEKVVVVYDRHFSHKDVKALLAFYTTDAGKKFIEVMPQLSQESMAAGQAWAQDVASRVEQKLQAAGYK